MSAQEERLQVVEFDLKRFKTETVKAYSDMAMEFAMVKGLTMDSIKRLVAIEKTLDEHTARFDRVDSTLKGHSTILNEHSTILKGHSTILNEHSTILNEHTARFDRLETMLAQILIRLPEKP